MNNRELDELAERKTVRVDFRCTPSQKKKILYLAKQQNMNVSDYVLQEALSGRALANRQAQALMRSLVIVCEYVCYLERMNLNQNQKQLIESMKKEIEKLWRLLK